MIIISDSRMKKAILVIDMLKEFVYGRLGFEEARKIVPNILKLIKTARSGNLPIIYVCDSHEKGDFQLTVWGQHAMKGTPDAEIIDELKPKLGEFKIEKKTYSGFYRTELEKKLKELNVDTLVLTGVHTHICVQHTAADAFFRGFNIVIPTECVAGMPHEAHENSLKYMEKIYNAKIVSLDKLLSEITG